MKYYDDFFLMNPDHYWKVRFSDNDEQPTKQLNKQFPFIDSIVKKSQDKFVGKTVLFEDDLKDETVELNVPEGVENLIRIVTASSNKKVTRFINFSGDCTLTEINLADGINYSSVIYTPDKSLNVFIIASKNDLSITKANTVFKLLKPGVKVQVKAVVETKAGQIRDDYIEFQHHCQETFSDIQYVSVNEGTATSQVNSLLDKQSVRSESYQDLKHVLIAHTAKSNSKPNLMIQNPDVIAKHGNNIGSIDDSNLEYLAMRGIDEEKAKQIIQKSLILGILEQHPKHEEIMEILL